MKRLLTFLGFLFLLVVVALAVFLVTFDADRYRPMVAANLQQALGRPVELERVSLRWHGGLAAELRGLAIYAERPPQGEPMLRAGRVIAELRLAPLLKGDVPAAIGKVTLREGALHAGNLSGSLEMVFEGKGKLHLRDLRLERMNLLREVFDRISVLPGLSERLLSRLPPEYQEKLNAADTVFQPVDLDFSLEKEFLSFGELDVATDSFRLTGSGGKVWLDGRLDDLPAQVRIEPDLSEALIRSVEELKVLTDEGGRIVIPLMLQGTLQRISVAPDLQYLTSKLLATKAQDLLGDLLNRVIEKNLKSEATK